MIMHCVCVCACGRVCCACVRMNTFTHIAQLPALRLTFSGTNIKVCVYVCNLEVSSSATMLIYYRLNVMTGASD